ncbi:transposase [Streptomyces sp. NPDC102467]|uniref:transposase n=1 Tax=Streptomyces sp. NPDC102467 TaxID=3366179 RepID=UPI003820448A
MGRGDLTDEQWAVLEPLLPRGARAGRPPVWPRRQLIDGIRFRVRTGIPWRDVPVEYGPWGRVYEVRVPRIGVGRPHVRPNRVRADKAYASRKNRAYLRHRGIRCTIPDKADQARNRRKLGSRGGRPPRFDPVDYRERHAVEMSKPQCCHNCVVPSSPSPPSLWCSITVRW